MPFVWTLNILKYLFILLAFRLIQSDTLRSVNRSTMFLNIYQTTSQFGINILIYYKAWVNNIDIKFICKDAYIFCVPCHHIVNKCEINDESNWNDMVRISNESEMYDVVLISVHWTSLKNILYREIITFSIQISK